MSRENFQRFFTTEKHVICPGKNYVVLDLKAENQDNELVAIGQAEVVFPDQRRYTHGYRSS